MPKNIKGLAGRTPPTPTDSHEAIESVIPDNMPGIQPVVAAVDRLITESIDGLHFAVVRKRPYYGTEELGWIIELAPYHKTMNIVFFGGKDFEDPPPLGDTDRTRYVKIATVDDAHTPQVASWIAEAGRTPGWS